MAPDISFMKILALMITAIVQAAIGAPAQHATARWLSGSENPAAEKEIDTVIRVEVAKGWHTYWTNPGEGGMPFRIKAEFPEGWSLGEIRYPLPKRFTTGGLPGFGYEGVVDLALTITAPSGWDGKLPELSAHLSWLTCNDETCVPGNALLTLSKEPEQEIVKAAFEDLPNPIPGAGLVITSDPENLTVKLKTMPADNFNPTEYKIFPATPNVVDAAADPHFEAADDGPHSWTAIFKKSPYLQGEPETLTLVLGGPGLSTWTVSTE